MSQVTILVNGKPTQVEETTPGLFGQLGYQYANNSQASTPRTQAELDAQYSSAAAAHPTLAGNTPEAIAYATSTGDVSGLVNNQGQPFSAQDQANAVSSATDALAPFYQAQQNKDTGDTTASLARTQGDYQGYLADQVAKFQVDKGTQDQTSANNGVLFSGGRAQRQQQLAASYQRADAQKLSTASTDIGNTARTYGYNYGDPAAQSLSQYYNLGSNNYNPNVATGGATSNGLSSIYNAAQGFQGTQINAAKAAAQQRAAGLLANKANKLVGTGYNNAI